MKKLIPTSAHETCKRSFLGLFLCLIAVVAVSFSSCSKDKDDEGSGSGSGSNALVGKWSYKSWDWKSEVTYTGYWTFFDDGTMLVEDRMDLMDGKTTTYKYNPDTKKLTLARIFVYQLAWISSSKFKIEELVKEDRNEDGIYTKVP